MSESFSIVIPKKAFFNYDISGIDETIRETLYPLYKLAERKLYEWESAEFPLPSSIFSNLNVKKFDLGIEDYLNIDECKQLAKDKDGQSKPLTKQQLWDMRQYGIFKVQSLQFPDKYHVWRIHCLLQKGTTKIYSDFKKDLSRVVNIILITAWNRIISKENSIRSSCKHIWQGLYLLMDLVFGMPHNNPGNFSSKLDDECLQFLTCELNVSKGDQTQLHQFWDYMERLSCLPRHYGADKLNGYFPIYTEEANIPFGIYQYLTPEHLIVDFRLANLALKIRCLDIVKDAVKEVEESDWFIDYRKNYIDKLCDYSCSLELIEKDLKKTGMKAKVTKVFEIIQISCKKNDIPDAICEIMISNAKYFLICSEVESYLSEMWLSERSLTSESLHTSHPFLSQTTLWVRKQIRKVQQRFIMKHEFTKLKMVIDRCALEGLRQHEYFSKRYLLFFKERKQLIEKELISNSSFPDRQYTFRSRMIQPKYWKVSPSTDDNGKIIFEIEKRKTLHWTSRYPCWRWVNYFLNSYMMMMTVGQFLMIKVPFMTPVSYLSLFLLRPFCTKHEFNPQTGVISKSENYVIATMYSRLTKLWNYVWQCRNKFESSAFHGMLDKNVARHFHRLWVVVLKGGVGTLGIVLIMPILCICSSTLCCLIGILVPFWVPVVTLAMHLGGIFIYDFQKAECQGNRFLCFFEAILWHMVLCGVLQLLLIVVVLLWVLPYLAVIFFLWAIIRLSVCYIWDASIFYMVLRRHAHIPAANDFVAKRISGPGLAYDYEILVKPEHVLLALRSVLEKEELDLWLKEVTTIIRQPLVDYETFIKEILDPLAVTMNLSDIKIKRLKCTEEEWLSKVHSDYNSRLEMLNITPFTASDKIGKLRLSSKNLQIVLEKSEKLCKLFYNEHLKTKITYLYDEEMDWWNKRDVKSGDFKNLAVNNLSYLFGEQILSSIEDCDEIFHLEVNEPTLSAYMDMFVSETYEQDTGETIINQDESHQNMSAENLQIKLRNFTLPRLSATKFFGHEKEEFPTPLKSCPTSSKRKRSRRWLFRNLRNWIRCCSNHYDLVDSQDRTLSIGGSKEPWDLEVYHPLVVCTLLHSRDRDNSMIDHDHKAVYEGFQSCCQLKYRPDFLDDINMSQSVDYSMSSLDNLSCELKQSLIA